MSHFYTVQKVNVLFLCCLMIFLMLSQPVFFFIFCHVSVSISSICSFLFLFFLQTSFSTYFLHFFSKLLDYFDNIQQLFLCRYRYDIYIFLSATVFLYFLTKKYDNSSSTNSCPQCNKTCLIIGEIE